ncbi:metallophosphatase [Legionella quateirensis]|uniref:Acid sphingomyelinase-like phosphodiesterase n=1 Tax=Legionella quateirensis TaxID=45072 RepID=A0A378KTJ7_9GAMM|nr:acid sphingomyelinase-like phosphodiesterase [Legionella quateirensis]STY16807.1 acid sphingomyelinase-like phosphodiesterase [Legionella quateirensis]
MVKVLLLLICIMNSVIAAPRFLTVSDIHYGSDNISLDGYDTGNEFLAITLNRIKELTKDVDFILYLGDLPTHSIFVTAKKEAYEKTLFSGLFEADQSSKPMFYITGNNDSLSGNYQPFELDGKSPLNFATDWTGACVYCEGLIIEDSHMRKDGYYSSYVIPGNQEIILFALNTVQFTKLPFYIPQYPNQQRDAYTQLFWLEQQLKTQQAKQLLIAMHVPPGTAYNGASFWHEAYLTRFIQLLDKYHHRYGQITLLASHTHMDEFRKIHLNDGTNIYDYSTPGISRIHHNNPGLKVFSLDQNFKIKDFITYYTTDLNDWGTEQYHAMGTPDAIFPNCKNSDLAQCLNSMNKKQVCESMETGLFYGVKSPRIKNQECFKTYNVN